VSTTQTRIPEWILKDRELGPGVILLTAPVVADKAAPYVNLDAKSRNAVIDWERLSEASRPWSHGERIFAELALHLWTGNKLPDLADPYRWGATLSTGNRWPLLEAIALALGLRDDLFEMAG
jgi:hypothetical protein